MPPPAAVRRGRSERQSRALLYTVLAHYRRKALVKCYFIYYVIARAGVAANRFAKMTISQGCHSRRVFWLYIYNVRCRRYLHANFQKYWPQKKNRLFSFKAVVHCFCCRLYAFFVVCSFDNLRNHFWNANQNSFKGHQQIQREKLDTEHLEPEIKR